MTNRNMTVQETPTQEDDMLERRVELTLLYDFYGALLKEKPKMIFEDYYLNDCSLREVAEIHGISRQGVFDQLHRTGASLLSFEEKLHLAQKFRETKDSIIRIKTIALALEKESQDTLGYGKEIVGITDTLLEEI